MAYKRRTYIAFNVSLTSNSEINLETAYNASKTNDEKISDGTLSGTIEFSNVTFWHDSDIKVKMNSISEPYNDFILFKKQHNHSTQHSVGPCKEVIFRNDSGGNLVLSVYAILNKRNITLS